MLEKPWASISRVSLLQKVLLGGPDVPSGFYAIVNMVFEDQSSMDLALSKIETALGDITNFTNTEPIMLIGKVIS